MTREEKLAGRIEHSDMEAVEELISIYYPEIFRYCLWHAPNRILAEDAVQETFLKAIRYTQRYTFHGKFKSFLYKIAANTCIDMRRKKWITEEALETLDTEPQYMENGFEEVEEDLQLRRLVRNPDLVRAGSHSGMYGVPVSEDLSLLFIYAKTYIDAALQSGSIDIYDSDAGALSFLTLQNAGNRSRDEKVFYAYISGGNDYDRDRRCRDDRHGNRNHRLEGVIRHFQLAFISTRSLFGDVVCCISAFAACENRKDSDLLQCHVFFCTSDAPVAGCVLSGML